VTVGFFEKVEGIEESSAFGPISSERGGWIAFEGSSSIGCCDLCGWGCWLLCTLLLRGTLLSKKLRVDLSEFGHLWLNDNLAGRCDWLYVDWYVFSFDSCLLDIEENLVGGR
jgi:hypothetical protein